MKKNIKIRLITATFLVVIGSIIFTSVLMICNWDFTNLNSEKYEMSTYSINDNFSNISIDTDTADILFKVSDDGMCKAECHESENVKYDVNVTNNMLTLSVIDQREWYDHISINFSTPKITVYLPSKQYNSIVIKESTGDIEISDAFTFNNVDIKTSTGDILLNNIIAINAISLETSTGDIEFNNCDASTLNLKASTGDIDGSLLSDKVFLAKTSTGRITVPDTISGGICNITTSTGDIKVTIGK